MDERVKNINILEIIEKLESRINAYWNFYTIVVVAVVGWLLSSKTPFTVPQGIVLTIAISMFFTTNFSVMRAATKRVIAFESELNITSNEFEIKSSILKNEVLNNSMLRRLLQRKRFLILLKRLHSLLTIFLADVNQPRSKAEQVLTFTPFDRSSTSWSAGAANVLHSLVCSPF